MQLLLPQGRDLVPYTLQGSPLPRAPNPMFNRVAFAAAHVVADPLADNDPWLTSAIDWDRTMAFRHHLWDLGFGVAEAMDTAQRGMGLDWTRRRHTAWRPDRLRRRHRSSRPRWLDRRRDPRL